MKPMREVAVLLQEMLSAGVITNYAVFGAVAQMRYTEAVPTEDADVLIDVPGGARLEALAPVYDFCRARDSVPKASTSGWATGPCSSSCRTTN